MKYDDGSPTNEADVLKMVCGFIDVLGKNTDDRAFDLSYCERCRKFDPSYEDPVTFLRNLLDACVYTCGCADNLIRMMQIVLEPFPPEDLTVQEARRVKLQESWFKRN